MWKGEVEREGMAQVETFWHTIKNHLGKFYLLWSSLYSYLKQDKTGPTNKGGEK